MLSFPKVVLSLCRSFWQPRHRHNPGHHTIESDLTPGLANKLCDAISYQGNAAISRKHCLICQKKKPSLPDLRSVRNFYTAISRQPKISADLPATCYPHGHGAAIGSVYINNAIRGCIDTLLTKYQIIHLCGKGNIDESLKDKKDMHSLNISVRNLPDLFSAADLVVARAGANSICELLALHKPNILIPLSRNASRGRSDLKCQFLCKAGLFCWYLRKKKSHPKNLWQPLMMSWHIAANISML